MQPITATAGPLATASANAICLSQTPAGAGAMTLNGALVVSGVAVMDNPRRVLITAAGNESAKTFTITGIGANGNTVSEVLAGVNNPATAQSVLDYKTVTSITISAAAAGAITVGTSDVGGSKWVVFDAFAPSMISIQCNATTPINYTVQTTLNDPYDPITPVAPASVVWVNSSDTAVVGATATQQSNFMFAPVYARILINSGAGSVAATFLQSSNGPK
jgi:hypothetical protein